MKKHVTLSLLIVALTSCGSFSPNAVTIKGETYKTNFYKYYGNNLHPIGIEPRDLSTADFKQDKYHYWELTNKRYHMYFGVNEESATWSPTIYCLSEELREAKEYYSDLDNYFYYIGEYQNEKSYLKIQTEKYLSAMEQAIKVMVTRPLSRKQNKKIDISTFDSVTIFRTSKDYLFTSTRDEFLYNEEIGFIYLAAYFEDKNSVYYTFGKENNELLSELYKTYKQDIPPVISNPGEGKSSY